MSYDKEADKHVEDALDAEANDPRVEAFRDFIREFAVRRAELGIECLKNGDERAEVFFSDATEAEKNLQQLLDKLGIGEE